MSETKKSGSTKQAAIRRELERLARKNGGLLLPAAVVDAARPVSSPLHSQFEWNESAAAHAHRLWQARQLITVVVKSCPRTQEDEQVWVSLTPDRKGAGGYRALVSVLSDEQMREQLLADALGELEGFRAKYKHLRELAAVFAAIDQATGQ